MDRKQAWIWGGAIVILAVVVLAVWPRGGTQAPATGGPTGPTPVYANKGSVVPQFPKELILDAAAKVANSYSVNYAASLNQYTAVWNSSSSMTALYNQYKAYFLANGWTITNDMTNYSFSRGLYATKGAAEASVAIVQQGKNGKNGSQVTVSYLTK